MKVRKKLTVTFILIVLIPLVLVFLVTKLYTYVQTKDLEETYEFESSHSAYENIVFFNKYLSKVYTSTRDEINKNVDNLKNIEYIEEINEKLEKENSFIVLKEQDNVIYVGKNKVDKVVETIKNNKVSDKNIYLVTLINGEKKYLIKQLTFETREKRINNVYVVTELDSLIPQRADMIMTTFISILFILIVTAICITSWIYLNFVYPIEKTREVAENIKDGNLDYDAKVFKEKDDEIARLNDALDQIRKKLKANAQDKVNDE